MGTNDDELVSLLKEVSVVEVQGHDASRATDVVLRIEPTGRRRVAVVDVRTAQAVATLPLDDASRMAWDVRTSTVTLPTKERCVVTFATSSRTAAAARLVQSAAKSVKVAPLFHKGSNTTGPLDVVLRPPPQEQRSPEGDYFEARSPSPQIVRGVPAKGQPRATPIPPERPQEKQKAKPQERPLPPSPLKEAEPPAPAEVLQPVTVPDLRKPQGLAALIRRVSPVRAVSTPELRPVSPQRGAGDNKLQRLEDQLAALELRLLASPRLGGANSVRRGSRMVSPTRKGKGKASGQAQGAAQQASPEQAASPRALQQLSPSQGNRGSAFSPVHGGKAVHSPRQCSMSPPPPQTAVQTFPSTPPPKRRMAPQVHQTQQVQQIQQVQQTQQPQQERRRSGFDSPYSLDTLEEVPVVREREDPVVPLVPCEGVHRVEEWVRRVGSPHEVAMVQPHDREERPMLSGRGGGGGGGWSLSNDDAYLRGARLNASGKDSGSAYLHTRPPLRAPPPPRSLPPLEERTTPTLAPTHGAFSRVTPVPEAVQIAPVVPLPMQFPGYPSPPPPAVEMPEQKLQLSPEGAARVASELFGKKEVERQPLPRRRTKALSPPPPMTVPKESLNTAWSAPSLSLNTPVATHPWLDEEAFGREQSSMPAFESDVKDVAATIRTKPACTYNKRPQATSRVPVPHIAHTVHEFTDSCDADMKRYRALYTVDNVYVVVKTRATVGTSSAMQGSAVLKVQEDVFLHNCSISLCSILIEPTFSAANMRKLSDEIVATFGASTSLREVEIPPVTATPAAPAFIFASPNSVQQNCVQLEGVAPNSYTKIARFSHEMRLCSTDKQPLQFKFEGEKRVSHSSFEVKVVSLEQNGVGGDVAAALLNASDAAADVLLSERPDEVDHEFPPNSYSLGPTTGLFPSWAKQCEALAMCRGKGDIFHKKPQAAFIDQGALGDAWLCSLCAVLCSNPAIVQSIFRCATASSVRHPLVTMRVCEVGFWQKVVLDRFFPVTTEGGACFARSTEGELWVSLLEKCAAKLEGSYAQLQARGRLCVPLLARYFAAFSGGTFHALPMYLPGACTTAKMSNVVYTKKLLQHAKESIQKGYLVCLCALEGSDAKEEGLAPFGAVTTISKVEGSSVEVLCGDLYDPMTLDFNTICAKFGSASELIIVRTPQIGGGEATLQLPNFLSDIPPSALDGQLLRTLFTEDSQGMKYHLAQAIHLSLPAEAVVLDSVTAAFSLRLPYRKYSKEQQRRDEVFIGVFVVSKTSSAVAFSGLHGVREVASGGVACSVEGVPFARGDTLTVLPFVVRTPDSVADFPLEPTMVVHHNSSAGATLTATTPPATEFFTPLLFDRVETQYLQNLHASKTNSKLCTTRDAGEAFVCSKRKARYYALLGVNDTETTWKVIPCEVGSGGGGGGGGVNAGCKDAGWTVAHGAEETNIAPATCRVIRRFVCTDTSVEHLEPHWDLRAIADETEWGNNPEWDVSWAWVAPLPSEKGGKAVLPTLKEMLGRMERSGRPIRAQVGRGGIGMKEMPFTV